MHASDVHHSSSRYPAWVPATLNAAWELWKPLLEDQELQKCDNLIRRAKRSLRRCRINIGIWWICIGHGIKPSSKQEDAVAN